MFVPGIVPDSLGDLFGFGVPTRQEKSAKAYVVNAPVPPDYQREAEESKSCLDPI